MKAIIIIENWETLSQKRQAEFSKDLQKVFNSYGLYGGRQ